MNMTSMPEEVHIALDHEDMVVREAFDKVFKCIITSTSVEQLATTKRLCENYKRLHNPNTVCSEFLESRIDWKTNRLNEGVEVE